MDPKTLINYSLRPSRNLLFRLEFAKKNKAETPSKASNKLEKPALREFQTGALKPQGGGQMMD
jgi:hypothetical protein